MPILQALSLPARFGTYIMSVFLVLGVVVLVTAQRLGGAREAFPEAAPSVKAWSLIWPSALSLAVTLVAIDRAVADQGMFVPLFLMIGLSSFVAPTFILYFAPLAAAFRFAEKRNLRWLILLVISLSPFGFWLGKTWSVHDAKMHELNDIASVPTTPLHSRPSSVLVEGADWGVTNCVRQHLLSTPTGIEEVFVAGRGNGSFLRYTRANSNAPRFQGETVTRLPDNYLVVKLERTSRFAPARQVLDAAAPPIEVYAVSPGSEELTAVSYTTLHRYPVVPPVLTTSGWYWGNNTLHAGDCRFAIDFVQRLISQNVASIAVPNHQ